jgi:hypothetical protein
LRYLIDIFGFKLRVRVLLLTCPIGLIDALPACISGIDDSD